MKTIILDNNKEYAIIKELKINNIDYTFFANVNEPEDICFRKTVKENGKEYYVGLKDKKELDLISSKFTKYFLENLNKIDL